MNLDDEYTFLDAGLFIGAILLGDPRGPEAFPIVENARQGIFLGCTSVGVLSEVYAGLTWAGNPMPHTLVEAARSVQELVEPPSAIRVLPDGLEAGLLHLQLAEAHNLTARRIHDARHAATALKNGIHGVYTYDPDDWSDFAENDIAITGPPSTLARLTPSEEESSE